MVEDKIELSEEEIRKGMFAALAEKFREFQERKALLLKGTPNEDDDAFAEVIELADHLDEMLEVIGSREDLSEVERESLEELERELNEFEKYVRDNLQYEEH